MRFMARPMTQTERPASRPASASVLSRAMLEAKVVATTMPPAFAMSSWIAGRISLSERPGWRTATFVESQTRARTPERETSSHRAGSKASPSTGVGSSLKSPVCTIRPTGVSMTRAELSGMECGTGMKCTLSGPHSTPAGKGSIVWTTSGSCPCSSILRRAMWAVKRRA